MQNYIGDYTSNSSGKKGRVNLNIDKNNYNFIFFFYDILTFTFERKKYVQDYVIELNMDKIYIVIKENDTCFMGEYRFYNKEEYGVYMVYKNINKNNCLII